MTMMPFVTFPNLFHQGLEIYLFQRQNCFPSFVFLVFFVIFLFSLCMRSHPVTQSPVTHTGTHSPLFRPFSCTRDTRSWTPGPIHHHGGLGRGDAPSEASYWRRWTWLLSTPESRHSYRMGPFTHTSDSVADLGRGARSVAPPLVGGP